MSADRWSYCPRCVRVNAEKERAAFLVAIDSYGKVSSEEFDRLRSEAVPKEAGMTMREDFWVSTGKDGRFEVKYSCACDACGFSWAYSYTQELGA